MNIAPSPLDPLGFTSRNGVMGALVQAYDWSSTPLGPLASWPRSLKTAVGLMLQTRQPCYIAWGPEQTSLYNDGYIPILGSKHPAGLGLPARTLWAEIWDTLGPINDLVLAGEAQWFEDMPFALAGRERDLSWFSFSYTPIRDDEDKIAGIFCVAIETTDKVLAERRSAIDGERLTRMFEQAPGFMALLEGPEHRFALANAAYLRLVGGRDVLGKTVAEILPEAVTQGYLKLLDEVYSTGIPYNSVGSRYLRRTAASKSAQEYSLDFVYQPVTDASGAVTGIFVEGNDVTPRVEAETALRASEERYRALFDAIDEGFCIIEAIGVDPVRDFRYIAANPAFETATGIVEVLGKTISHVVPDEAQAWINTYAEVLVSGKSIRFRRRLIATGRMLELFAYRLEDGTGTRVAVLFNDITARMRAETDRLALLSLADLIRETEDPDQLSFEAAKILGETLCVSRAGYGTVDTRSETIRIERDWNAPGAKTLAGTLHFRDYGSYIEDLKRGETVIVSDAQTDPRTAATAAALEAISARSLINMPVTEQGDFVALLFLNHEEAREWTADDLALVREVAERTRTAVARLEAERELRRLATSLEQQVEERTAELDRVWRNSRDLLLVIGSDGIFRAINPAWTTILGHDPRDVVGRSFRDFIWPDDAELTQGGLDVASEQDLTDFKNRYRHKDGTPRWISWHTAVEGDLVYAYGRDITESKRAAAELAQAQEALRQSQKLEAVGQLTGGVAHDFNNLLTIIKSSSELLGRPDLPEERRRRYIEAISETVSRASKLTGQLLAFARRQSLKPEVFDVAQRVRGIAEMLGSVVGARIPIVLDIPDEPCRVEADASQFETALVNLVVNARDAMDGEGRITLKVRETFRSSPGGGGDDGRDMAFVAVSINDTGVGMPAGMLGQIFEPFFTTKEVGKGTGLGLSQVYGFAKQSGGDVSVESRVGQGSTFTLVLPRTDLAANVVAQDGSRASTLAHGAGRRVLVVEDNAAVGAFSTTLLQDLGYETTWAISADDALARLHAGQQFDVVFSDVMMPGINGIELGREIRRKYPHLPVILTSGYSEVLAQKGRHGFELLQKPYAAEELSRVLRRICGAAPDPQ